MSSDIRTFVWKGGWNGGAGLLNTLVPWRCGHSWRVTGQKRWVTGERYESGVVREVRQVKIICKKCGKREWHTERYYPGPFSHRPVAVSRETYEGNDPDLQEVVERYG